MALIFYDFKELIYWCILNILRGEILFQNAQDVYKRQLVHDIEKEADRRMYASKARYYSDSGIDRRK